MEASDQSFASQPVCNPDEVQDGDNGRATFMFSVDLMDAYFQIPVLLESPLFLHFTVDGKVYQFRVLCLLCYRSGHI